MTPLARPLLRLWNVLVAIGEALLSVYERLAARSPAAWILFVVAVILMVVPLVFIRGYHFEEGLTVSLARDVLDGGNPWYEPYHFGYRWVERPVLLSWLIAVISWPFGEVLQLAARLPIVLSLYGGALLVYFLLKDAVSRAGAIFGALCFLFSPMVLNKVVTAESDLPLTVTQFAAFFLWWRGYGAGRNEIWRWAAIGLLLGATALFKGPQPAAFFGLGVGAFLLWRRQWTTLPGFALSGGISLAMVGAWYGAVYGTGDSTVWLGYMRLDDEKLGNTNYLVDKAEFLIESVASFMPGLIAAIAGLIGFRRVFGERQERSAPRELFLALLFFCAVGLIAALIWPGAKARYVFSAVPAVAAMAGLMFDRSVGWRRIALRSSAAVLTALIVYQLVWNLAISPLFRDRFAETRIAADEVRAIMAADPAPLQAPLRVADAVLAYLDGPVTYLPKDDYAPAAAPAWFFARGEDLDALLAARPDLQAASVHDISIGRQRAVLARIAPR